MNLPNKLTLFRIFLIPVFVLIMLLNLPNKFLIACIIFKLLVISALTCMIEDHLVSSWMVIIIVARELTVSILRAIAAADGKVIAAGNSGKLKTITQMVSIVFLLLGAQFENVLILNIGEILILIATLLTLYSGWEYLYKNKELFMSSK